MKKMEEYNKDSIERLIPDSIELMEKHLQDLNTKGRVQSLDFPNPYGDKVAQLVRCRTSNQ